jgi:hypothetical protein
VPSTSSFARRSGKKQAEIAAAKTKESGKTLPTLAATGGGNKQFAAETAKVASVDERTI